MQYDSSRNVTDEEILQWAEARSDDAGYVCRLLLAEKSKVKLYGPYGWLIKPIGMAEDSWYLSDDASISKEEESTPLWSVDDQILGLLK